ncbi:hypothetical protein XENOCAPTIV_026901 [Xenoophorus captivus]|uniref:Uncharacterized protein n=1 Tax=Xenoophorus captivus TaxID=1517983 RepID=A0ABV0QEP5_9TELE
MDKTKYTLTVSIHHCDHLYKSSCFVSLLLQSIQASVNTMPGWKDKSKGLREVSFATHKVISKLSEGHHFTDRKIIPKWKTSQTAANLPRTGRLSRFSSMSEREA